MSPVTVSSGAVAGFPKMLREDRERSGLTVDEIAWRLGVSRREYRELEAGRRVPNFQTWDRMCKLFGWTQRFEVAADRRSSGHRRST